MTRPNGVSINEATGQGASEEADAWMRRVQEKDDEEAFSRLMAAYRRRVLGIAYRFLQNRADAEDAVQEAFIRLYRARDRYRPGLTFTAWFYTIVNRVCLNSLRYRRRHPARSLDELEEARTFQPVQPGGYDAAREEMREIVRRAVAELPDTERMALILDQWEGLSQQEIAEALEKSVPAVKSMLFRTRAKLKIKLAAYLDPEDKGGSRGL